MAACRQRSVCLQFVDDLQLGGTVDGGLAVGGPARVGPGVLLLTLSHRHGAAVAVAADLTLPAGLDGLAVPHPLHVRRRDAGHLAGELGVQCKQLRRSVMRISIDG